jgi:hypothetical protein
MTCTNAPYINIKEILADRNHVVCSLEDMSIQENMQEKINHSGRRNL